MNITQAMSYVKNSDPTKETVVAMHRYLKKYCVFILRYEVIDDDEPEYNGPRYTIEYIANDLKDVYCGEGETYDGRNLEELEADIIELISTDRLTFHVYQTVIDSDIPVYIYQQLLPELMPQYDAIHNQDLYTNIVDRVLHSINQ